MKLTAFLTFVSFFVLAMAGEPLVPELLPVAKDNGLLPRASATLTFCTGTSFSGQCNYYVPSTDVCYSVPAPYVNSLFSSRASPGYVCFLYRGSSCTDCEACVDAEGYGNTSKFVAVHTLKCVVADAAGCSDAFGCKYR